MSNGLFDPFYVKSKGLNVLYYIVGIMFLFEARTIVFSASILYDWLESKVQNRNCRLRSNISLCKERNIRTSSSDSRRMNDKSTR